MDSSSITQTHKLNMLFWEITDALVHGRETEEKYQSNFYQTRLQTMLRIIFRNETQDIPPKIL